VDLKRHIEDIVTKELLEEEFLVDVIVAGANAAGKILILIDGDNGINIDRCAEISRKTAAVLEAEDTIENPYILEVSSPGLEHPLKLLRQYKKNIGRTVKIVKADDSLIKGELIGVDEKDVTIRESKKEKGSKKELIQEITIPFTDIKKTNVLVSFK
jgi:ribosome maturation factor RimP